MAKYIIVIEDVPPTAEGSTIDIRCDMQVADPAELDKMTGAGKVCKFITLTVMDYLNAMEKTQAEKTEEAAARCWH